MPGMKSPKLSLQFTHPQHSNFSMWCVTLNEKIWLGLKEWTWRLSLFCAWPAAMWKLPDTLFTSSTPHTMHPFAGARLLRSG